jgi:hypothetical protein
VAREGADRQPRRLALPPGVGDDEARPSDAFGALADQALDLGEMTDYEIDEATYENSITR